MLYVRGYNTNIGEFQYFKVNSISEIVDPYIVDLVILHRVSGVSGIIEYFNWYDIPKFGVQGQQIVFNGHLYVWSPNTQEFVFTDWYDSEREFRFRPYTTWFHEYEVDGSEVIDVA